MAGDSLLLSIGGADTALMVWSHEGSTGAGDSDDSDTEDEDGGIIFLICNNPLHTGNCYDINTVICQLKSVTMKLFSNYFSSDFPEILKQICKYYMHSDVCSKLKSSSTLYCVICREKVKNISQFI